MVASLMRTIALMILLGVATDVGALELLADPTRPAIDAATMKGGAASEATAVPVAAKEVLQSIVISPQYRAAVINGETVVLGEKFRGATLLDVRESSVLLSDAQGKRVLELYPGVRIKKVEPVSKQEANVAVPVVVKPVVKNKKQKALAVKKAKQKKDEGQHQ
jgi:MSHA biogenesis protein MshK